MSKLLTPKQVAQAIQVSESSVKRWCDAGTIYTEYTVGGHRRIAMASLVDFVRSTSHQLVQPAVVDLAVSGRFHEITPTLVQQFTSVLLDGCEAVSCQILTELYLAGHSVAVICDNLVAPAFCEVGELWHSGDAEVFQERRACELCHRAIYQLRSLISEPRDLAPLAIGAAPADDSYSIATSMAELVLLDNQWRAISLGGNLPFESLQTAIEQHQPSLFWMSVSHIDHAASFVEGYRALHAKVGETTPFVVGGKALTPEIRKQISYSAYCDNMQHLESFAKTVAKR